MFPEQQGGLAWLLAPSERREASDPPIPSLLSQARVSAVRRFILMLGNRCVGETICVHVFY